MMHLVQIGPVAIHLDDVRAIRQDDPSGTVEVTFRDGSTLTYEDDAAEALRTFMLRLPALPDCSPSPYGPNDATTGVVGRRP